MKSTVVRQDEQDIEPVETESQRIQRGEVIQLFGRGLQAKFDKQVGLKEELEQRWLDDLRHYNGRYDRDTEARMADTSTGTGAIKSNKSRVFVNLTRAKSNIAESKWSDLVLPTDDRNWGIQPTPVPDLVKALEDDSELVLADGAKAVDPETEEPYTVSDEAKETMDQATKASDAMQTEMDDQLVECHYNSVCREVIHDAVVQGIGIIKGPMVEQRTKKAWLEDEAGNWELNRNTEHKPTAERVDPWNFFPDMSAVKWEDCEYVFERHLLTKKQIRLLAKQPGYMVDQIRNVLEMSPNARASKLNYLNELREINGITQIQNDNRYEMLEYHGPVEKSDLVACGCKGIDEADPLDQYEGTVWIIAGVVIKVALNHMDSEELPYNLLNWEKDETSVFGFGVPYRMRSPQRVMNASWRMVLDNAGLSTGPQVIINRSMVQPADGSWTLSPRKIWWLTSTDTKVRADYAMHTFDINSNQEQLTAIFEMAKQLGDEETSVPQQQMGGQAGDIQQPAMLKTLGGTALWMSANNIMMRRAVKNFDDDITVPFIGRFYDWNMQFNKRSDIKGDYSIDARGTSVLLVREMQARNIMEFITAAMTMPGGPEELKVRGVLKNMAKGMQVSVDDVMRSDAEKAAEDKAIEEQGPPPDPELEKLNLQREIAQMEMQARQEQSQIEAQIKVTELESAERIAGINREIEMSKMAMSAEGKFEEIRTKAGIERYKIDVGIRQFFEEMKIKKEEGQKANYGLEAEPS